MGYSTEFSGKLTISPPLSSEQVEEINEFCAQRHGGPTEHDFGMPGFWCDWEVDETGTKLYWNGAEKSYHMDKWLEVLIKKFIVPAGSAVNGRLFAQGEDRADVWLLIAENNQVSRLEMNIGEGLKQLTGYTE